MYLKIISLSSNLDSIWYLKSFNILIDSERNIKLTDLAPYCHGTVGPSPSFHQSST